MKGILFTEFFEYVEDRFGIVVLDKVIQKSSLKSEGVYTSVGSYSYTELIQLFTQLSNVTSCTFDELLRSYAERFMYVLHKEYSHFFDKSISCIDFLSSIDDFIHVEVRKLYPDAELPVFRIKEHTKDSLVMVYFSNRGLYLFAQGLILSAFKIYGGGYELITEKIKDDGTEVVFKIMTK